MHHYQRRIAYAAAIWAFVFAAINLYWALGGTLGILTLGEGIGELALAGDPQLFLLNGVSVVGKIVLGGLALAVLRPWHNRWGQRLLRFGLWAAGILLMLYGVGNLVQHSLMLAGTLPIASLLRTPAAVLWHLLLWDPVWIVGGILFVLLAVSVSRNRLNPAQST